MKGLLFVDNEERLLEVLVELSESRGYAAEGVTDAKQAVERIKQNGYHTVIVDASEDVPVEGFATLSDWIKRNYGGIRLIALTGQVEATREGAIWGSYYAILSKFYVSEDISMLYRCIEEK